MHEHQLYPFDLGARCCQLTNDLVAKLGDYGLAKSLFPEDYLSLEISLDAHKRFEGRTIFKPNFSPKFREIKTSSIKLQCVIFSRFFFSKLCFFCCFKSIICPLYIFPQRTTHIFPSTHLQITLARPHQKSTVRTHYNIYH